MVSTKQYETDPEEDDIYNTTVLKIFLHIWFQGNYDKTLDLLNT